MHIFNISIVINDKLDVSLFHKNTVYNKAVVESRLRPRLLYHTLQATDQWQRPACRHR